MDKFPFSPDTHCATAPSPPEGTNVQHDWNGDLIDFDAKINYTCKGGLKPNTSLNLDKIQAQCLPENGWDGPQEWISCVESECEFHILVSFLRSAKFRCSQNLRSAPKERSRSDDQGGGDGTKARAELHHKWPLARSARMRRMRPSFHYEDEVM